MAIEKILYIPDTHVPYHNAWAFELVLKVAKYYRPEWLVILGDFCDFYKISVHSKDPQRLTTFTGELKIAAKLLRRLEKYCGPRLIYLEGNHEFRLPRLLQDKAPELYELFMAQDLLELEEHGWEKIPYKTDRLIGKVFHTHDIGLAGIHSTRQSMVAYQDNCIVGHNHRMDYHVQANAKGIPHIGASFGWLGDVDKVDYLHRMKARSQWATGFGWARYDTKTGFVYVTPIPIIGDTCCVEGKLFKN